MLIVDDETLLRAALEEFLNEKYQCTGAASAD
jgi:DNA-binding NarL/FixJ family response regulator